MDLQNLDTKNNDNEIIPTIMNEMEGKENSAIRKRLKEEGIPDKMINELAPAEEKKDADAKPEEKPAEKK